MWGEVGETVPFWTWPLSVQLLVAMGSPYSVWCGGVCVCGVCVVSVCVCVCGVCVHGVGACGVVWCVCVCGVVCVWCGGVWFGGLWCVCVWCGGVCVVWGVWRILLLIKVIVLNWLNPGPIILFVESKPRVRFCVHNEMLNHHNHHHYSAYS